MTTAATAAGAAAGMKVVGANAANGDDFATAVTMRRLMKAALNMATVIMGVGRAVRRRNFLLGGDAAVV